MYRDLYDIWLLGSYWLTGVARGDFVTLVVGSQEPSGEWVKRKIEMHVRNYVFLSDKSFLM